MKKIAAFILVLVLCMTLLAPGMAAPAVSDPNYDASLADKPTPVVGRVLTPDMTGDTVDWIEIARNGKYSLIIRKEFLTIYPNKMMGGKDVSRDYKWQYTNGFSIDPLYKISVVRTAINRWFNGENWSATLVGEHDRLPVNARLRAFTMQVHTQYNFGTSTNLASLENGYSMPSKYQVGVGDDIAFALSFGEAANFLSKCSYHRDYYETIGGVKTYVATKPSSDIAVANYNRMVFPTMTDARWGMWLRSPGDVDNSQATLDAAPPAPLQGGVGIGRVFQEYVDSTSFRGYIYPSCWVDQEIFTNSTKAPPAPVTAVPTVVDGRILTPAMTGDTCNWIEIAQCGDASLIIRERFIKVNKDAEPVNYITDWQSMGFGMVQRSLNPRPLNNTYFESYPQYFINIWFGGDPWFIVYGTNGYRYGSDTTEKLPLDARLRDYALQGTMKQYIGTSTYLKSLTDGLSRPTHYQTGVGNDVAFALSFGEAASFISKCSYHRDYYENGQYVATRPSDPIAVKNYSKLFVPYYIPTSADAHRWFMWLRSPGDTDRTAANLDLAPPAPLQGGESIGRVFQEYFDVGIKERRGLAYPAMWVGQGIFGDSGKTVTGKVWPIQDVDLWGIGDSFMRKHDVVVELRSTFLTPAPANLRTTAASTGGSGQGEFTFTNVPNGNYVLYIKRPGYLTRAMLVSITDSSPAVVTLAPPGTAEGGIFRLWWGDCNDDYRVDNDDVLMILELMVMNVNAFHTYYNAACDMDGDGRIDNDDILMVLEMWDRNITQYPGFTGVDPFG